MSSAVNRSNEFEVLCDPYPKTGDEWIKWVHRYKYAIGKDLDNNICENCGYGEAMVYEHKKGAWIYGKEYSGKELYLCEECAESISKRFVEIQTTIEGRHPDKSLYGNSFNICFGDNHPLLYKILFFYFIISGLIVFSIIKDMLGLD
jgi:hypothetical protein